MWPGSARNIVIQKVLNGFVVTADCQKVVFDFEREEDMWQALRDYFKDPATFEEMMLEKYGEEGEKSEGGLFTMFYGSKSATSDGGR